MKINVKEWLSMNREARFYTIALAARHNNESKKAHKKSLQALTCK